MNDIIRALVPLSLAFVPRGIRVYSAGLSFVNDFTESLRILRSIFRETNENDDLYHKQIDQDYSLRHLILLLWEFGCLLLVCLSLENTFEVSKTLLPIWEETFFWLAFVLAWLCGFVAIMGVKLFFPTYLRGPFS